MKLLTSFLCCIILSGISICSTTALTNKIFCYFQSNAVNRIGNGAFNVENINAKLCTHIAFSFIGLNTDGTVKVLDSTLFEKFINLKSSNPNVKLLASIGGWIEGSITYSVVAATKRSIFVTSVYDFLNTYGFDGLDFNWQYPGLRGGIYQQDKINFMSLLRELKEKFAGTKLLTAAVGATANYLELSYDAVQMNEYLDLINLMSYNYNGAYDPVTGRFPPVILSHNAPLYSSKAEPNNQLNQNASVNLWITAGVNPSKLLLGIPFYGRGFVLTSGNTSIGAPCTAGPPGPYAQDASGILSYLEICEKFKSSDWTSVFDGQQKVSYFYNDNEWIGYDGPRSVQIKTEYAVNQKLAGVMVWSLDFDDDENICGDGAYPLLNSINRVLSPPTTHQFSCTITQKFSEPVDCSVYQLSPLNPPTPPSANEFVCTGSGVFRDPNDCSVYYVCRPDGQTTSGFIPNRYKCNAGLVFDINLLVCNYDWNVQC